MRDALEVKCLLTSLVSIAEHLANLVNFFTGEVDVVTQADLVEFLDGHLALLAVVLLGAGSLHETSEDTAPLIRQL